MLLNDKYKSVACDVLIFPDQHGNYDDAALDVLAHTYLVRHYVEDNLLDIVKSLRCEFVVCYKSGTKCDYSWLSYTINSMIIHRATAFIYGQLGAFVGEHIYDPATSIVTRDLFIELLIGGSNLFHGMAVYSPKRLMEHSKFDLAVELPRQRVSCDIIVPFNSTRYLCDCLDSLVSQQLADCVIHAIDDGSGEQIDELVCAYPQVKWYRNKRQIGQFLSVNNVVKYCNTDFLALADADDVSTKDRIWLAITAMTLSGADIYGSQAAVFVQPDDPPDIIKVHRSLYPYDENRVMHPLINSSVVIKKSAFVNLAGYTDFGNVDENKCANDTEFMTRAFYAGLKFHIGQAELVNVRLHNSSCTNIYDEFSLARSSSATKTKDRMAVFRRSFNPSFFGAGFSGTETEPYDLVSPHKSA